MCLTIITINNSDAKICWTIKIKIQLSKNIVQGHLENQVSVRQSIRGMRCLEDYSGLDIWRRNEEHRPER